jgi:hypothetical protein
MTRADRVLSTPPTNTPVDTTRRRFLAVSSVAAAIGAGSLAAAAMATNDVPRATPASPARASSGCSLEMATALGLLDAASHRLRIADEANDRRTDLIDAWDRENPMPASKRGKRRNIKRAHAYYIAITGYEIWQAVVAAENDFHAAQEAIADIECLSREDLNLLIEASLMHDDRDLSRGNRAPIARALVRALAGGRLS